MRPIPAGVLGVGRLGAAHARLLAQHSSFHLVGVHDRVASRAAEVADDLSVSAFAEAAELYARAEAVVIAVPTAAHHAAAVAAISAGCHALVEKPLASTVGEADEIVRLAESRGVVLGVGHVERFNGILQAAEPLLDRPRFIESLRMAPFRPRGTDVTVVLDLMIHDIDLVLTLTSAPLADVRAVGVSVISPWIDLANARLSFEDGTVANITASRVASRTIRQLRLFQRSGYFSLDLANATGHHDRRRDPPGEPRSRASRACWSASSWKRSRVNLWRGNSTRSQTRSPDGRTGWFRDMRDGRRWKSRTASPVRSRSSYMSLLKIREERKKLGGAVKRGPRTIVLVLLLAVVIMLMIYLGRIS